MGVKRMIWRYTGGWRYDLIKNINDEGGIVKGFKKTVKEDICEDNPLTKAIYELGKYDGEVEGYQNASSEYEKKLFIQADEFISQKRILNNEIILFNTLLDEYEEEINKLNRILNRTDKENKYLQELLLRERKLKKINLLE